MTHAAQPAGEKAAADYLPHVRAERLIASARACMALFSLIGVLLDPLDPDTFFDNSLHLLLAYSGSAVIYWLVLMRGWLPTRRAALVSHLSDLAVAVALTLLTRGSGSPYFLFFTFLLLCGTVRWAGQGAWWTGLTVMLAYALVGVLSAAGVLSLELELNRFAIRLGMLFVMTLVLVQVGTYQRQLYEELRQLARWPRDGRESLDDILREELGHAAVLLDVREVRLAWRLDAHDVMQFAGWRGGQVQRFSDRAAAQWPLLLEPTPTESFVYDARRSRPRIISGRDAPRERMHVPLEQAPLAANGIHTLIGAPLPTASPAGWVLLLDRVHRPLSADDLMLADIVAGEIGRSLERWYVAVRAREAALAEERLRVARDLHDGILQSLTGCRLNLSGVAASAAATMPGVAEELVGLERAIAHEQQGLRRFIQQLRPSPAPLAGTDALPLRHLCERVQRQWRIEVTVQPGSEHAIPATIATDVLLLCHEALVNAARHGAPTHVGVLVERIGDDVRLMVADNGSGFSFAGRYDTAQLAALGIGPRTLRERAEALGGTLTVVSSANGSTVEIRLPAHGASVCV